MPVARSRSGPSMRLSERHRKRLNQETDTPAQVWGRSGKQELQKRLRQLGRQGPMALLDLMNIDPATARTPWQNTDLMVRVRAVLPEAPTPDSTLRMLLAGGLDPELEGLLELLRLSVRQGTEKLVTVARGVVDREKQNLLEAAMFDGALERLGAIVRQASEHARRPARVVAQAMLHALEDAPSDWQARLRRCEYGPCPRPFFWDATDNGRKRFCSKRHGNAARRARWGAEGLSTPLSVAARPPG
jgi:hypothetical protein